MDEVIFAGFMGFCIASPAALLLVWMVVMEFDHRKRMKEMEREHEEWMKRFR